MEFGISTLMRSKVNSKRRLLKVTVNIYLNQESPESSKIPKFPYLEIEFKNELERDWNWDCHIAPCGRISF